MYPIVEFAKLISKNTAEFTRWDIDKYISWLWSRSKSMKNDEQVFEFELTKEETRILKKALEIALSTKKLDKRENQVIRELYQSL